jgi:hypothetical protein
MPRSLAAQTAPKVIRISWLTAQRASSLPFLVKQGYGVRDARDEPAQAGEQQQFFDLPDHDVLPPRRSRRLQQRRGRTLGSTRGFSSKEEPARGGRGNLTRAVASPATAAAMRRHREEPYSRCRPRRSRRHSVTPRHARPCAGHPRLPYLNQARRGWHQNSGLPEFCTIEVPQVG